MITIYSIPHTGTRFVESFFLRCGIRPDRRHVGYSLIQAGGTPLPDGKRIIPVRNPYDSMLSWQHLHPERPFYYQVCLWGRMMWRSQEGAFFFPLDINEEERLPMLRQALIYAEGDPDDAEKFSWHPINLSGRPKGQEVSQYLKDRMSFAHEWYEYYTRNWGYHEGTRPQSSSGIIVEGNKEKKQVYEQEIGNPGERQVAGELRG